MPSTEHEPEDDSPDALEQPGVTRLNKRPLIIVALVAVAFAIVLAGAVQHRVAMQHPATTPAALDNPPTQYNAVDASPSAKNLTQGQPSSGVTQAVPLVATPKVNSTPPATQHNHSQTLQPSTPPITAPPQSTLVAAPLSPERIAKDLLPTQPLVDTAQSASFHAEQQRKQQLYDTALAASTRVDFSVPHSQAQTSAPQPYTPSVPTAPAPFDPSKIAQNLQSQADPNHQPEKEQFAQVSRDSGYLLATRTPPISHYEIKSGAIIPGVLIGGLNSDLPGYIVAQVREDVYDSATGRYLLIPQGSKLFGVVDSRVAYGQTRVLIAWTRLIFPDSSTLDLAGMSGVDMSGYTGFNDQVNNHYWKIFGSALLMSSISAGVQLSQPVQSGNTTQSAQQQAAAAVGQSVAQVSTNVLEKNLSVQPTLIVRPGYLFNVMVSKDIAFKEPYTNQP